MDAGQLERVVLQRLALPGYQRAFGRFKEPVLRLRDEAVRRVHVRWTRRPAVTKLRLPAPEATQPATGAEVRPRVLELLEAARGPVRVAEMADALTTEGWTVEGDLNKVISDLLRSDVRWGRVERVCRGVYRWRAG